MTSLTLLALDPGNEHTAFVVFDGIAPQFFGKWPNQSLLREIQVGNSLTATHCAIETMKPRGMPTSFEEMQTQLWAGRFFQAWYDRQGGDKYALGEPTQIFRHDEKMCICGKTTANDSNIRRALIDRWGGDAKAVGGKKCPTCKGKGVRGRDRAQCSDCKGSMWLHPPGPLHGVADDVWQALAVAVCWWETKRAA